MGVGGPTVTVQVDREFVRAYRRALVRDRRGRLLGLTAVYAFFGVFATWQYVDDGSWSMFPSLAIFVGLFVYGEAAALRRDCNLPVGHELVAEFGEVTLRAHAPGFLRELTYANFRHLERRGAVMRLADGTGAKTPLPAALFTEDTEAGFRQHAHPRDLTGEPLPSGWLEMKREPRVAVRLAWASVLRNDLPNVAWPVALLMAVNVVLGILVSAETAVLFGGFLVILLVAVVGHAYTKLRDQLEFKYDGQVVRVGPEAGSWVVDSVNFRERIDPAQVTFFERRKGVVFLRHRTAGEERNLVFPEQWVAGALSHLGNVSVH